MRQKTRFILILLAAVFLVGILGIGAGLLRNRLLNIQKAETESSEASLLGVEVEADGGEAKPEDAPYDQTRPQNAVLDENSSSIPRNDENGQNAPSGAREGQGTSEAPEDIISENGREVVHFDYCKDGDTIVVTKGGGESITIRFIGINTPESVAPEGYTEKTGKENNDYGKKASDYTKSLLKDTDILYLEYDEEFTDSYGRTLAYVYLSDTGLMSDMVNAKLLTDGYASLMQIEPNIRYAEEFKALFEAARDKKAGLWQDETFFAEYQTY